MLRASYIQSTTLNTVRVTLMETPVFGEVSIC